MNKKVLFIVNSIKNGGAERVCSTMAETCTKLGYEVDFVTLSKIDGNITSNEKIRYHSLNYNLDNKFDKILCAIFGWHKLNKIIKNNNYSLITSHLLLANIVARLSSVSRECVYVSHCSLDIFDNNKHMLTKYLMKKVFSNRKVSCVSDGVRNELIDVFTLRPNQVYTIYNPLDTEDILAKSSEYNDYGGKPYLLLVGRLTEQKRFDRAIEIFAKGNFKKDYNLLICGTGELENELRTIAKQNKIEHNVIFAGWQDNIYKWIQNAELLLNTSDYEGFPMTLLEAFACGTKVVSSDCHYGPNEIMIDEFSNYLVPKNDIGAYIEKINLALKTYPKRKNPILAKCDAEYCIKEYIKFAEEPL